MDVVCSALRKPFGCLRASKTDLDVLLTITRIDARGAEFDEPYNVEMPLTTSMADVKLYLQVTYDIGYDCQVLSLEPNGGDEIPDNADVSVAEDGHLYLFVSADAAGVELDLAKDVAEDASDDLSTSAGAPSLHGVTWRITFVLSPLRRTCLDLEALSTIRDACSALVSAVDISVIGEKPIYLTSRCTYLPADLTLYDCGLRDGSFVKVVDEPPDLKSVEYFLEGFRHSTDEEDDIRRSGIAKEWVPNETRNLLYTEEQARLLR